MMMNNAQNLTTSAQLPADHPLSAKGRFSRLSYLGWLSLLSLVITGLVIAASLLMGIGTVIMANTPANPNALFDTLFSGSGLLIFGIMGLLFFYLGLVLSIRRLHDINLSGWWMLVGFIPVINFLFFLYISVMPGTATVNRFGPPRPTQSWEKVLGWIYVGLNILTIVGYALIVPFAWYSHTLPQ